MTPGRPTGAFLLVACAGVLAACSSGGVSAPTPASSGAPAATVGGEPDVTVMPTPAGRPIIALSGTGPTALQLPSLPASTTRLLVQVDCRSGSFVLRSREKAVFGGTCGPGGQPSAEIPLRLIDRGHLAWSVKPGNTWRLAVWAR